VQRRYRLRHSVQFQRVRREGQAWPHPLLVFCAAANDLPYSRFGIVASKHIGNAVVRNRVKRLLREAIRVRRAKVAPGWDVVLVARTLIVEAVLRRIGEALDSLLQQAGLIEERRGGDVRG